VLRSFEGVGPKCAHLALGIACGELRTRSPEQTMAVLERQLPAAYWMEINGVLVPFGKHVCTGRLPRCSACPVLDM
jgi:endonuclease-3